MSEINRLDAPAGSHLDRDRPLNFTFDGQAYTGCEGDTVASALAANNAWLLSRSFKYHRPRGILTMAGQDANTMVSLPGEPNALADRAPLVDGLAVRSQNVSGSLRRDRGAWIQWCSRFLPVGFYYHAFYRPSGAWKIWSKWFRGKAGLGEIDTSVVSEGYDKRYRHCDVAVVGAGPAGMQTALREAEAGAEVLLIDENSSAGGSLNYARSHSDVAKEQLHRAALLKSIAETSNIELMTNATVNSWHADHWLGVVSEKCLTKLRAKRVVLCTGALEQAAQFRNNDLPGIMLGSAAQRLVKLYAVRPGRRAVILAGNDDGYGVALDLLDSGVEVVAVIELRSEIPGCDRADEVARRGVNIRPGHAIYSALGSTHVNAVDVRRRHSDNVLDSHGEKINCDLLCMSVGYMPTYQLACQAGGQLRYDDTTAAFSIRNLPAGLELAGDVAGGDSKNHPWPIFPHPKGMEFVDFDEDLHIRDIENAVAAGYRDIQLVKRYSTCGMGPSQGRHSALPTARIVAAATRKSVTETGVTTARPPFATETLAHCAGNSYYPAFRTSIHHRHASAGAQFLQAGPWYRPAYYGDKSDPAAAIASEVAAIRNNVGLIDVSTLGGIELRGPDSAEFLNRIYTFAYLKQQVRTLRYALMTNEAGVVVDDGVACRLDDHHFYVTTTTGGADRVFRNMLQWNARWQLDVHFSNATNAYCGVNIAGPRARDVLSRLASDIDLASTAFPYLGVREGTLAGIPVRLLRVGFVGELGFEIHAPQHFGEALWDALMQAGAEEAIQPVGIEAQRMLRLEKGHIILGQDTDATSSPAELNMSWAIATKKPYFVGKRSVELRDGRSQQRILAGFTIDEPTMPVPRECHLVIDGDRMIGRVTSSGFSHSLGRTIGLAYVPTAKAIAGTEIAIRCDSGTLATARICELPFYDADNLRQAL